MPPLNVLNEIRALKALKTFSFVKDNPNDYEPNIK